MKSEALRPTLPRVSSLWRRVASVETIIHLGLVNPLTGFYTSKPFLRICIQTFDFGVQNRSTLSQTSNILELFDEMGNHFFVPPNRFHTWLMAFE
jgi:hypothetical protein